MVSSSPCLLTVPIEVLHHIAEDLAVLTPLGPPSSIVPLMLTCSTLNSRLSVARNPTLFAAIYRRRLDHTAIERRVGRPTLSQWARWGSRVFEAMRIFRRGDIWYDEPQLLEALRVGVMFMLDDDGKNVRQMLLWARADVFVQKLVMERIYERAHENQGWPRETPLIAYALQLWYLLSSEESVLSEPPEVRDRIMKLLVPFVYCPFRYASSPYPPNHFIVPPLLPSPAVAPTTIPTAHGQYPLYPDSLSSPFLLANGKTVKISPPQPALMAKLIYMAREEAIPLPIAPDMHRTRAEREAAGITDVGPVQEDIEEFNWSYTTPHPLGTGLRTREGLLKRCQDWNGAEWEAPLDMYDHGYPSLPKRILFGNAVAGAPFPQWATKAPLWDIKEKSKRFDMVFGMMLAFGDLDVGLSRKPFADGVYEPGTADGLWVGRILVIILQFPSPSSNTADTVTSSFPFQVSDFHAQEILSSNPMHPPYEELTVESLSWYHQLSFLRLREIHGVQGEVNLLRPPPPMIPSTSEATNNVNEFDPSNDEGENSAEQEEEEEEPFGLGPLEDDDGMSNAWFLNPPTVLPPLFSEPKDIVRLSVPYIARTGIYRANTQFKQHKGGDRLDSVAHAHIVHGKLRSVFTNIQDAFSSGIRPINPNLRRQVIGWNVYLLKYPRTGPFPKKL
ncbi:hypothetical protein H0H93_002501 [Arthromyces matolae]|nr:hypothetical protein H0H93_002501 [Arthromyces matolae]